MTTETIHYSLTEIDDDEFSWSVETRTPAPDAGFPGFTKKELAGGCEWSFGDAKQCIKTAIEAAGFKTSNASRLPF